MRIGGTSAGGIVAAAMAFGLTLKDLRVLLRRFLVDENVLDLSLWPFDRWGLHGGDKMERIFDDVFQGAKLRDAVIPLRLVVCDLWTRRPVVLDSRDDRHGAIEVAHALRATSAIPLFFKAQRLKPAFGERLFVDGGVSANFALHMFDDVEDRRTVGVRLERYEDDEVRPVKSAGDYVGALASLLLHASDNAHISNKRWQDVVRVPAVGDGLSFRLSPTEFDDRWMSGQIAAARWCDA
jgi:predicted acylesterase/phospholipase RssA